VIPQAGIDLLRQHAQVEVNESDTPLTPEELHGRARGVHAIVTLLTDRIDRAVMTDALALKAVCNVAVGYDNIDIPAATELGIVVTNTPGILTDTTADFAWALLMAIARRIVEADAFMRGGKYTGWGIQMFLGSDIHHATLGLVGMGRIGQGMAQRAMGFDMRVLYYDEVRLPIGRERELGATFVDMDALFAESDFVSIHTPLTPGTRHLVNWERLTKMKPTACIVNTSRGPVVNEGDLARALREGKIAGAALDVFENEPRVNSELLPLPNVIMTPHIASASVATRTRMATMAAENCIAVLAGDEPPNLVNPEVRRAPRFKERMTTWA
jgi:lactate dehydrogenase-like 2-hydroxyacid dehydrogenase